MGRHDPKEARMALFSILRRRLERRAHYLRTRHAIRHMPLVVAHDLDIDPMQADRIARSAVYGA